MTIDTPSEVGEISKLLLKTPQAAFISQNNLDQQWRELNYTSAPNYEKALEEYDLFANLLAENVDEIHFLPPDTRTGIDSIYVRDSFVMTPAGAILCQMGKDLRREESATAARYLDSIEIPIQGEITGDGCLEGGDLVWLDQSTLIVGLGYRTNQSGIDQLRILTQDFVNEFIVVPLPHWNGPADVLHLMSFLSPISYDLLLIYPRLIPVPFLNWLQSRDYRLIEVPDTEYESMGCNVLALSPNNAVMLAGNPITRSRLEKAGVEVAEYSGYEISLKGGGGPTCLTRPLLRQP